MYSDLSIKNGIVSSKIYDKGGDFNFEIVNFTLLNRDVPRPYGVFISQLIHFRKHVLMSVTSAIETILFINKPRLS